MNEFLILAFGLLMPFVVSGVKSQQWPDWAKVLTSLLVSVLCGAVTAWANGTLDLANLAGSSGIIFTASTVVYKTWFQHTNFNQRLEAKEVL